MHELIQFVLRHGYLVLFAMVLGEQVGLPIPALPVLLAMGALVGGGHFNLPAALLFAVLASLIGDLGWYVLGRFYGHSVLNLLCRISLEPDSCVHRTEALFERHGPRSLLIAKFVPALSTVAPPLSGMFRMNVARFLLYDGLGAVVWAGSFLVTGYVFSEGLERVASTALGMGSWLAGVLVALLAVYLLWKYIQRRRFFRSLSVARIMPEELHSMLQAGEGVIIVDLRHRMDVEHQAEKIQGAIHIPPEELEERHLEIPRDEDIILYCT